MTRAIDRLARWLEHEYETDADTLALVRMFYAVLLLVTGLPKWLWIAELPPSFFQPPIGLASLVTRPPPIWAFYALNALTVAATVSLFFGLYSRAASVAVAAGLLIGNSFGYAFGKIDHEWVLILVPLAGAAAGWGNARGLDGRRLGVRAVESWPVALVAIAIGFGMLYAGAMKWSTGWLSIDHLAVKTIIIESAFVHNRGTAITTAVEIWPSALWEAVDWTIVAFECLFVVAVLRRRWFLLACAAAAGFHFANAVTLRIPFTANLPGYALVVQWTAPKWWPFEAVSRASVALIAMVTAALYCLVGNPAWLLADAMGWEGTYATQLPFAAAALAVAGWWIATRSGLFSVSRPVPTDRLTPLLSNDAPPIVLFDGYCGLCNGWVDLVIRHDQREAICFLPLQTATGAVALSLSDLPQSYTDSIVLVHRGRVYTHSSAVLHALMLAGRPLWFVAVLLAIPAALRDVVYRRVAANRYRWFGRRETCRVPSAAERQRFLTDIA